MSTRCSKFYKGNVHIYHELMDDWVYLEAGPWITVRLYPSKSWFISMGGPAGWLLCRLGVHCSWLSSGLFDGKPAVYKCVRCGHLTTDDFRGVV